MKPAGTPFFVTRTALLTALLLCAPALAQDDPKPPKPAAEGEEQPAAPAPAEPAEKKERKVSPEGQKALDKVGAGLHLPMHYGVETIEGTASGPVQMVNGDITLTPKWSKSEGFDVKVALPESAAVAMPPEFLEATAAMIDRLFGTALGPLFLSPNEAARDYDVGHKVKDDQEVVELLPFAEETDWERVLYYLDDDGLIEQMVGLPRIDYEKDPPSMHAFAGVEIEVTFGYEKKGERSIITSVKVLLGAMGEIDAKIDYFELDGGRFVPSKASVQTPYEIEPIVIDFYDYMFDGKAVAATAKKAITPSKPEDVAGEEKPAESGSDADAGGGSDGGAEEK